MNSRETISPAEPDDQKGSEGSKEPEKIYINEEENLELTVEQALKLIDQSLEMNEEERAEYVRIFKGDGFNLFQRAKKIDDPDERRDLMGRALENLSMARLLQTIKYSSENPEKIN